MMSHARRPPTFLRRLTRVLEVSWSPAPPRGCRRQPRRPRKIVRTLRRETDACLHIDIRSAFDEDTHSVRVASQRGEVDRRQAAVIGSVHVRHRKRRSPRVAIARECRDVEGGQSHAAQMYRPGRRP